MGTILKRPAFWVICCALLTLSIYGRIFYPPTSLGAADPDRYFHLWVSQQTALHGLVRAIPQADNLSWVRYFPDKEFFFHLLTGLGYRIHGDWGALSLAPAVALALLLVFFFTFCSRKLFALPPYLAFIIASLVTFASTPFTFRLFLLRPHLLGILFWLMSLIGLISFRRWFTFFGALFFALSYHAFYMPLIFVFIFGLSQLLMSIRPDWKLLLLVPAGLVVGIILNPYFPDNAVMGWIHLKIALGIGLPPLDRGQELNPLPLWVALSLAKFQLAILMGSLAYMAYLLGIRELRALRFVFLIFLSTVIGSMYLRSPRANEYWVPTSALLLAEWISLLRKRFDHMSTRWISFAPLLCFFFLLPSAFYFYRDALKIRYKGQTEMIFDALSHIPASASGEKIFNCNWTAGSLILYRRPDLRFVDLLDPAFLYIDNPEAHRLRMDLNNGYFPEPAGSILRAFRSRYVLCDYPPLNALLEKDPLAVELAPANPRAYERLFELLGDIENEKGATPFVK